MSFGGTLRLLLVVIANCTILCIIRFVCFGGKGFSKGMSMGSSRIVRIIRNGAIKDV